MFCSKCGKEISDDSKYCSSCGSKTINVENTDVSSLPSNNIEPLIMSDVKMKMTDDINDEPLPVSNNENTEDIEKFETFLKDEKNKERGKWGWGWVILLLIYSRTYPIEKSNKDSFVFESLGYFVMLILYFWIRNYVGRYYDDYKPSLISGIVSYCLTVFLVSLFSQLFIRL